jgi:hypothetical protein
VHTRGRGGERERERLLKYGNGAQKTTNYQRNEEKSFHHGILSSMNRVFTESSKINQEKQNKKRGKRKRSVYWS